MGSLYELESDRVETQSKHGRLSLRERVREVIAEQHSFAERKATNLMCHIVTDLTLNSKGPTMLNARTQTITVLATAILLASSLTTQAQEKPEGVFSRITMEIGFVVSDLDKAAKFYTEVVGMTEVPGFTAPAAAATKFGLTDNQAIKVRKFAVADVKDSPAFKMMEFPEIDVAVPDQKFIHSTLGWSYLTMFVNDMGDVVARAEKGGVKFLGETPAKIGGNNYLSVYQDPDGNFIELIGPAKTNLEKFGSSDLKTVRTKVAALIKKQRTK